MSTTLCQCFLNESEVYFFEMFATPFTFHNVTHFRVEQAIYWEKMWAGTSLYPSGIDWMVKIYVENKRSWWHHLKRKVVSKAEQVVFWFHRQTSLFNESITHIHKWILKAYSSTIALLLKSLFVIIALAKGPVGLIFLPNCFQSQAVCFYEICHKLSGLLAWTNSLFSLPTSPSTPWWTCSALQTSGRSCAPCMPPCVWSTDGCLCPAGACVTMPRETARSSWICLESPGQKRWTAAGTDSTAWVFNCR